MHQRNWMYLSLLALLTGLSGCGSSSGGGEKVSALEAATPCINCHGNATSPGTGQLIVEEWKKSAHATADGASCRDCHEPAAGHPNTCNKCHTGTVKPAQDEVARNPDAAGKCLKCHDGQRVPGDTAHTDKGYDTEQGINELGKYSNLVVDTQRAHFNNITSGAGVAGGGYPATFVASKYRFDSNISGANGNCRKCHNPHDPTSNIRYNEDWARSGHGTTHALENKDPDPNLAPAQKEINVFRLKARNEQDFKLYGSRKSAADEMSDSGWSNPTIKDSNGNSVGVNAVCVRCHTTTGYINFIKSGFTDLSPWEGPGFSNTKTRDEIVIATNPANTASPVLPSGKTNAKLSNDLTRELTNCNACHDDGNDRSYDFKKLRAVPPVKVHYNFAGRFNAPITPAITKFSAQYPDARNSNICIACHSGRLIGLNVKMSDKRGLNWASIGTGRLMVDHFRGAALMLLKPTGPDGKEMGTGFEFYTSASLYDSPIYSHKDIGINTVAQNGKGPFAGDSRGHGPCIGCHLNVKPELKSELSSHTFLPVNLSASDTYLNDDKGANQNPAKPITSIVSNACAQCHNGTDLFSWTPEALQAEKDSFNAAVAAFRELLLFAVNADNTAKRGAVLAYDATKVAANTHFAGLDADGRAALPTNFTGSALQTWLRKPAQTTDNAGYPLSYTDPLDPAKSGSLRFPAYTYGAVFNWYMVYYDPGAFAHNPLYVKRLMYDSMDWLDDGILNQSVAKLFCNAPVYKDAAGNIITNSGTARQPVLSGKVDSYTCADTGTTLTGLVGKDNFNMRTKLLTAGVKTTPNGTNFGKIDQAPVDWQKAFDYLLKDSAGNRPVPRIP